MQTDLSLPTYRTDVPAFGDPGHLRFFVRASPRGMSGLCYQGPLDLDAHWTLNAYMLPQPVDGPCPEPPRARYASADFSRESQAFAFGAEGGVFDGELEVPLMSVLAMVLRVGRELDDGTSRYTLAQRAHQRPGLAALAAEVQAEMWRRAGAAS